MKLISATKNKVKLDLEMKGNTLAIVPLIVGLVFGGIVEYFATPTETETVAKTDKEKIIG